jgi:periplasmic protein TonB
LYWELKNKSSKPTLDDIAFEGRNKEYGAYLIRKKYQVRLFRSFIYSLCFFLCVLLLFERFSSIRSADYYYNPWLDAQVVGVNLSNNPYAIVAIERTAGASSPAESVPEKIVADDEVVTNKEQSTFHSSSSGDSTGIKGSTSTENGTGNSNTLGGMDGEVYGSADINPQFPGGPKAMQEFINANLKYPEIARRLDMKGTILIYIVIASDGSLRDVKVVKGLQPDLDSEAVRVVKSMPLWKPALRGGVPVNVRCVIPITVSPLK